MLPLLAKAKPVVLSSVVLSRPFGKENEATTTMKKVVKRYVQTILYLVVKDQEADGR